MASPLPRLRADLDIMPSPLPEQPGLIVRDPFRFSEVTLLIPPLLARCLACFDGEQDEADLRATLARLSGQVAVATSRSAWSRRCTTPGSWTTTASPSCAARASGNSRLARARVGARGQRLPVGERRADRHAAEVFQRLDERESEGEGQGGRGLLGIAAPHVSPEGGSASYAAAYRALPKPTATTIGSSSCSAPRTTASPIASV